MRSIDTIDVIKANLPDYYLIPVYYFLTYTSQLSNCQFLKYSTVAIM